MSGPNEELRGRLLRMAAAGATVRAMLNAYPGYSEKQVRAAAEQLVQAGRLHRAPGKPVIYYTQRAAAEAKPAKDAPVTIHRHYKTAPWSVDTPADYSRAKVTVAPTPPLPLRTSTHSNWGG